MTDQTQIEEKQEEAWKTACNILFNMRSGERNYIFGVHNLRELRNKSYAWVSEQYRKYLAKNKKDAEDLISELKLMGYEVVITKEPNLLEV